MTSLPESKGTSVSVVLVISDLLVQSTPKSVGYSEKKSQKESDDMYIYSRILESAYYDVFVF